MKIAIVIPILNNFKGAVETLASVQTTHDWEPIFPPQWRINRPLSAAWNLGIDVGFNERNADYVLVINDDILFAKYTIDTLVEEFQNQGPEVVLLTACNDRGYIDSTYGDMYGVFELPPKPEAKGNFAEHPDFSCFMIKRNFLDTVGFFDENFVPAYFEDNDMHYRINLLGYKAGCTSAAPYYHIASQTTKSEEFHDKFRKNQEYYTRKWGALPGQESFKTPYDNLLLSPKDWIPGLNA